MRCEPVGGPALPKGWCSVALERIASKIRSGATPKGGGESYLPYRLKYVLVRSQNVFDHHFDDSGLANISDDQAADLIGAQVEEGDVLLNITGDGVTFGRTCVVPSRILPACVNQHVMLIRLDQTRCLPDYLVAWLTDPETKKYIESFNAGGSRRAITKGHIQSFVVPVPPMEEQRVIAGLVSALNSRIDLLRSTNCTLESIAQAIFKSWFIDFDPVRAKAEGREPEGMNAETAGLFSSEFEESELGPIPRGWAVSTLGEHIQADRGVSYKGSGLCQSDEGRPMHNLNSVYEGGGYKYSGIKYYRGDHKARHVAHAGDIIVANTEQGHEHRLIGFPAIVPGTIPEGLFSHHIYRVELLEGSPLTQHTLYYLLMSPSVRGQITGCTNGSTVNMLKSVGLEIPRFVCPPTTIAQAFEDLMVPIRTKLEASFEQADSLANIRDTLLPRLISGKLRIPEAQAAVEEAALT